MILEGKVPFELRPYFFGAKLIALKKARWTTSSYRCGQYFPPVFRKVCRIPCLRITSNKIRKSTSRCRHQKGAELDSRVFRCLIETTQPRENVDLKVDFENVFELINRHFMLKKFFEIHPEVYKYSHLAFGQPSFLFFTIFNNQIL